MQRQAHIQVRVIILLLILLLIFPFLGRTSLSTKEGDDNICMSALWLNIQPRVTLTQSKLMQDLIFFVSTLRRIPPHLPMVTYPLWRIKIRTHTIRLTHLLPVHTEQTLDNQKRMRRNILARTEVP